MTKKQKIASQENRDLITMITLLVKWWNVDAPNKPKNDEELRKDLRVCRIGDKIVDAA